MAKSNTKPLKLKLKFGFWDALVDWDPFKEADKLFNSTVFDMPLVKEYFPKTKERKEQNE